MTARVPLPPHLAQGPFTVQAARDADLGAKRMRGADLQRPFHGVRVRAQQPLTMLERATALQLKLPGDAFFCGVTAAVLMGVPLPMQWEKLRILNVTVPAPRRAPSGRGVRGHTAQQLAGGDMRIWRGLRISSPERLWCELGAVLSVPDLVAAGDYLIHHQHPLTSRERLVAAVASYAGRRGLRNLRAALPLLDERAESRKESMLRVIVVQGGFDGLAVNHWITTSDGYRYRADLAFPGSKVAVEYQSDYHASIEQFRADMTRISRLQADGWTVIQVNADDLGNPVELLRRIRRVLAGG